MDSQDLEPLIRGGYDQLAPVYAEQFTNELDDKPFDRALLTRFADAAAHGGWVCDVGCGPAHVAQFLRERGVRMCGADLSYAMLRHARAQFPGVPVVHTNMLHLGIRDAALAGIVAFYSLIHLGRAQAPQALQEFARVLVPGGRLAVAVHGGTGDLAVDEVLGQPVHMYVTFFKADEIAGLVEQAGFRVEQCRQRPPYAAEYPRERVYILARSLA